MDYSFEIAYDSIASFLSFISLLHYSSHLLQTETSLSSRWKPAISLPAVPESS